ncbi:MAG: NAD(P)/FAD-dependent oxidoreductase, partial [Eggerthellaceae bacterium]|nr:NAD(P)/FAD-dependent oxidoreductase [Eggerthellaceae bacterium]
MKHLAIIGGGASGLAAGVSAAKVLRERYPGKDISIGVYEAFERVGRSILATGNGRCNFSNANIDVDSYKNPSFVKKVYASLSAECSGNFDPVGAFFAQIGLIETIEPDGRKYPRTSKASSVVDVLRFAIAGGHVDVFCACVVDKVVSAQNGDGFVLMCSDGRLIHADAVIVAVGTSGTMKHPASNMLEAFDIPFDAYRPVLGPIKTDNSFTKLLDGVRVKAKVSIDTQNTDEPVFTEEGELLFRKYGVSGICVFNASRYANPGDILKIDFVPDMDKEDLKSFLVSRIGLCKANGMENVGIGDVFRGFMVHPLVETLLNKSGIDECTSVDKAWFETPPAIRLLDDIKGLPLTIKGIEADQAQVKRGGYGVSAFGIKDLSAKSVPGLYAAGEALD